MADLALVVELKGAYGVAVVAMAAAYTGLAITLAAKPADAWPFAVLLAVTGFGYLLGLSMYGSAEPDPADDADAGHEARFPVSR